MVETALHPLRAWRLRQVPKLTLDAAAAGVGSVRSTWHDWESGRRKPEEQHILRLFVFTRGEITANSFFFPNGFPDLDTGELPLDVASAPFFDAREQDDEARQAAEPMLRAAA